MPLDRLKISANFDNYETKCHCKDESCQHGAKFVPDAKNPGKFRSEMHPRLLDGLEQLRALACEEVGRDVPLIITSGGRCPPYNHAIGGNSNSEHLRCAAVDCFCPHLPIEKLAELAKKVPAFANGGIGVCKARNFLHLDVGPKSHFVYPGKTHDRAPEMPDPKTPIILDQPKKAVEERQPEEPTPEPAPRPTRGRSLKR